MTTPRRPKGQPDTPSAPRASRALQRQRLIDACISALHVHGPSKTTVEKVVAIAGMSPGIVRFYFDSKDAMLVASLEFLAAEFESRLLEPVAALARDPVEALEQLVELYLGPELASARKVSVWYSFWGEASSRQEYFDICGTRDSKFESLVRDLVATLIERDALPHLDADAVALGLIGVLEMLWQGFAFQTESTIDRATARRRAMAYLRSVFPSSFTRRRGSAIGGPLPASAYRTAAQLGAELEALFRGAWQFAGLSSELATAGDYVTLDGPVERALVVRGHEGVLRAFANTCRHRPHPLAPALSGHLDGAIGCALHNLGYELSGEPRGATAGGPLESLQLAVVDGLLWVRAGTPMPAPQALATAPAEVSSLGTPSRTEIVVAADWKVLVEHWLERPASPSPTGAEFEASGQTCSSFVAPHQLLVSGPDGLLVLQAVPAAAGRTRLRIHDFPRHAAGATSASRPPLAAEVALAEAVQRGIESPGYVPEVLAAPPPALADFRRSIARLLPGGSRNSGD